MVQSTATTVAEYLGSLTEDRRATVAAVRDLVNEHLPAGYDETMRWGMISWEVPLTRYPSVYNGQPLSAVGLAAQKRYTSLYLPCVEPDTDAALARAYERAGLRLDFGKSCLRFRSLAGFLPGAVVPILERATVETLVATYEAGRTAGARP